MKTTKRILSMILCLAMVIGYFTIGVAAAEEISVTMAIPTVTSSVNEPTLTTSDGAVTLSTALNGGQNKPIQHKDGELRIYTKNKVTFTPAEGITLKRIEFTTTGTNYQFDSKVAVTGGTLTVNGNSATIIVDPDATEVFFINNKTASGKLQVRIKSIKFVYTVGESGGDTEPPCEHANTTLIGAVDATCTTAGYTGDEVCDDCGKTVTPGTMTAKLEHTDADGNEVCDVCEKSLKLGTFKKVTENLEDWSGKYLIVYEDGSVIFDGSLQTLDVAGNYISVTISENKISISEEYAFVIEKVANGYSIKSASGYYISGTSGSNKLNANASAAANTLTINDDGELEIVSNTSHLRFNAGTTNGMWFRYFKSTTYSAQKAVTLYKLETAGSDEPSCEHEYAYNTTETTHTDYCTKCDKYQGIEAFHDTKGENGKCGVCGYAVDANVLANAIIDAAYALEINEYLPGTYELTGVITEIGYKATTSTSTATVTIVVNGLTDKPIKCYYMGSGEGTDVSKLVIGDTITVSGSLMRYNETTVEFASGCKLVAVSHEHTYEWVVNGDTHYQQCKTCGDKTADAAHVDEDQDKKCDSCGESLTCDHIWEDTYDEDNHYQECENCGDTQNVEAHNNVPGYDAEKHWTVCSCGYTVRADHNLVNDKCSCGYVILPDLGETYKKVEDPSSITGGYFVIGGISKDALEGVTYTFMSGAKDGTNDRQKGESLAVSGNFVTTTDATMVWELIATEGGFYVRNVMTKSYLYYKADSTKNAVYLTDNVDEASVWVITEKTEGSGDWTLSTTLAENAKRYLSANIATDHFIFAAYGSNTTLKCALEFYAPFEGCVHNWENGVCLNGCGETHEHAEADWTLTSNTAPSCTVDGSKTFTCSVCGQTKTEPIDATGHSYNEGIYTDPTYEADGFTTYTCTVCGHSYTDIDEGTKLERFDVERTNMRFGSDLSLLFAFKQSELASLEGVYAEITKDVTGGADVTVTVLASDETLWTTTTINGVKYYVIEFTGIAAKEMTSDITIVIKDAEGNALSNPFTSTIQAYAMDKIVNSSKEEFRVALVDMLNYGAAAQDYFDDYNMDKPANGLLTEEQKGLASAEGTYEDKKEVDETYYNATNLRFVSKINLLFRLKIPYETYAVFTWTDHYGKAHEVRIDNDKYTTSSGMYVVELEDLVVADARQMVTCTIYKLSDNSVVTTVVDSVEGEVASTTTAVRSLYVAFMKFADSAYEYLH